MKKILIHGLGHQAASWNETIALMKNRQEIECPECSVILNGKEPNYLNLYTSFTEYCRKFNEPVNLCGISLGGILALNYALDFPDQVNSLVLIGTPYKIPRLAFAIQNIIFRFLPEAAFKNMGLSKKDISILANSMKKLDFSSQMQSIQCPVFIICGKKDSANLKAAHDLKQNIKNSKLAIIENAGHVVNEEKPEILAKLLDEYYNEADPHSLI